MTPDEPPEVEPTKEPSNEPVLIKVENKVSLLPPTTPIVIEMAPNVLPAEETEVTDSAAAPEVADEIVTTAITETAAAAVEDSAMAQAAAIQTDVATATLEPTKQQMDEQESAPESTPEPTPESSARATAEAQIEDPTFYRGSYRYDPVTGTITPDNGPPLRPPDEKSVEVAKPAAECVETPVAVSVAYNSIDDHLGFPRVGRAMYYNPGIMERVLSFRMNSGHVSSCDECVGHVALLDRSDLNRKIWLEWENGDVDGPFLVIDVAARHHVDMLLQRHWVVDIDYQTAMRIGMNRPLPVTVWDHPPR